MNLEYINHFEASEFKLLTNQDYLPFLKYAVANARNSVYAFQYISLPSPSEDHYGKVRSLLHAFARASWRGVDVRILLDQPDDEVFNYNLATHLFLESNLLGSKIFMPAEGSKRTRLHSKVVIIDHELVIIGSHNWTDYAFRINDESSVAVWSKETSKKLARTFQRLWDAQGEYFDREKISGTL